MIERLNRPTQARAGLLLMLVGVIGVASLVYVTEIAELVLASDINASRTCFFVIGLGFGYPYFVTVKSFALHFGGEQSALVIQTISLFGFAVCASFVALASVFACSTKWTFVILMVLGFSIAALLAMFGFHLVEWKSKHVNLALCLRTTGNVETYCPPTTTRTATKTCRIDWIRPIWNFKELRMLLGRCCQPCLFFLCLLLHLFA